MTALPVSEALIVAAVLFTLGAAGVLVRRDVLFILLSLEVMMNAAGLAFVIAGAAWLEADGQILFLFVLAIAAVEVALGLALIVWMVHRHGTLDVTRLSRMRG